MLTLDKDVNEMQLTFDMFKDCVNQFACLRLISQRIHFEMGLNNETNITKAYSVMKDGGHFKTDADVVAMVAIANRPDSAVSRLTMKRLQSQKSGLINKMSINSEDDEDEGIDLEFVVEGDFFDG